MNMIAKISGDKRVVVRFKFSPRSQDRYIQRVFLPYERMVMVKLQLAVRTKYIRAAIISPINLHGSSQRKMVQFVLPFAEKNRLNEIESLFDIKGRINTLVNEAIRSRTFRAHDEDLSVAIEDMENVEDFVVDEVEEQATISGMTFYEYTEKAHALLSQVIAGYSRLELQERKKEHPDAHFLEELQNNQAVAFNLLRKADTFSSIDQMSELISDYTPIVRALYEDPSTHQA